MGTWGGPPGEFGEAGGTEHCLHCLLTQHSLFWETTATNPHKQQETGAQACPAALFGYTGQVRRSGFFPLHLRTLFHCYQGVRKQDALNGVAWWTEHWPENEKVFP